MSFDCGWAGGLLDETAALGVPARPSAAADAMDAHGESADKHGKKARRMRHTVLDPSQEPVVLSEELIHESLTERNSTVENIADVDALTISFRFIRKIDNLAGFEKLRRLKLDNNLIPKMENIGHLVNLRELDLSFNQIEKIEGLENLVHLQELYLFHNRITKIENMTTLTELNILSLGDNNIADLDNLQYLRQFKRLQALSLGGNKVCEDDEYQSFVLAHCCSLVYLDYQLIDSQAVKRAREQHHDEIQELEDKEAVEEARLEADKGMDEQRRLAQVANVAGLDTFFEDMKNDDIEMSKMRLISSVVSVLAEYQDKFNGIVDELRQFMLTQHAAREKEEAEFDTTMDQIQQENGVKSLELIQAFEKSWLKRLHNALADGNVTQEAINEGLSGNERLYHELMDIELHHVEQSEQILMDYGGRVKEAFNFVKDNVAAFFRRLVEQEGQNYELMVTYALEEVSKANTDEAKDHTDEQKALLSDKTAVNTALKNSTDFRQSRIHEKEDEILDREKKRKEEREATVRRNEDERNRSRVSEIWNIWSMNRLQITHMAEEAGFTVAPAAGPTVLGAEGGAAAAGEEAADASAPRDDSARGSVASLSRRG